MGRIVPMPTQEKGIHKPTEFQLFKSCFANSNPLELFSFEEITHLQRSGYWENVVLPIRAMRLSPNFNKKFYQRAKQQNLPIYKPHQNSEGEHSGYFFFDLDREKNRNTDFQALKNAWIKEGFTVKVLESIAGKDGLSWFVKAPEGTTKENHQERHTATRKNLENKYQVTLDRSHAASSFDANKFVSVDADLYYNPKASPIKLEQPEPTATAQIRQIQHTQSNSYVRAMLVYQLLKAREKSITAEYDQWVILGFSLINSMPREQAKELFHKFSSLDSCYEYQEAEKKFSKLLNSSFLFDPKKQKAQIGTIVHLAQQQGINIGADANTMTRKHPLNGFMPGKHGSTRQLQARILCQIDYFASLENPEYQFEDFTRINSQAIGEALGIDRSTVSRHIKKLSESGFIELTQPLLSEKNTSYFAKLSSASIEAQSLLSSLKIPFSFNSSPLCNLHLNELHFFIPTPEKENPKTEKRKEHTTICVPTLPNPTGNRISDMRMERTKPKPANKRYVKPFTEEVRRAYQSFQDTLKKHAGRRIENVQIQRIFSEVYADIELINKYIPSFLASRNASDIYFYLSDRKYLDFAQPKENIPIPTNQAEATALNDRYKFAELVFKHKYLPCLILNGKKSPLKVPGGIPYQIGNRYFVNKSNVKIELNLSQLADYQ